MITLAGINAAPVEVEPLWQQGGLAIHHGLYVDGDWSDDFTITHVDSGWAVRQQIATKEQAIHLATSLLALGDWTRNSQDLYADRAFFEAVRQCQRDHGHHLRYSNRRAESQRKKVAAMLPFTPTFPGKEMWP